jgi:hypothetical protein
MPKNLLYDDVPEKLLGKYEDHCYAGGHKCVQHCSAQSVKVLTSEPQYYTFDAVAGEGTDQASLFKGETVHVWLHCR